MSITYSDIRERRRQVDEMREQRNALVIKEACALIAAYERSLELESPTWTDIKGVKNPYVIAGVDDNGNFKKHPTSGIELDERYGLRFALATVIDDSPHGGDIVSANIYLWVDGGETKIIINDSGRPSTLIEGEGRFKGICEEIKTHVLMQINDPALD